MKIITKQYLITQLQNFYTKLFKDADVKYLTEHQDLSGYSTTEQMNEAISGSVSAHNTSETAHNDIRAAIPSKTSALTNDSGFVTSTAIDQKVSIHNQSEESHADIRETVEKALTDAKAYTDTAIASGLTTADGVLKEYYPYAGSGGAISINRRSGSTVGEGSIAISSDSNYPAEASEAGSFAMGYGTTASGNHSHAEGDRTRATSTAAHAEGVSTTASGYASHAEGVSTTASGYASHAEGYLTRASGYRSHAEGSYTTASGDASHAEGNLTRASGGVSHAEGSYTTASGYYSHAEGYKASACGTSWAHGSTGATSMFPLAKPYCGGTSAAMNVANIESTGVLGLAGGIINDLGAMNAISTSGASSALTPELKMDTITNHVPAFTPTGTTTANGWAYDAQATLDGYYPTYHWNIYCPTLTVTSSWRLLALVSTADYPNAQYFLMRDLKYSACTTSNAYGTNYAYDSGAGASNYFRLRYSRANCQLQVCCSGSATLHDVMMSGNFVERTAPL